MKQNSIHRRLHLVMHVFFFISILLSCGLLPAIAQEHAQTGCPGANQDPEQPVVYNLTARQSAISSWAQAHVKARVGNHAVRQNSNDLETLYAEAAAAEAESRRITQTLAKLTGGTAVFPPGGGLKGKKRAREKIAAELGGDASGLMDIARSSIEYPTVDAVYQALQFLILHGYDVVRMKDRAIDPLATGFWDIHLNLRTSNNHIIELQLHLRDIRRYSMGEGHKKYEQVRSIEATAVREGRLLTPEERATIDRLNCEQKQFYKAAFQRGQTGYPGSTGQTTSGVDGQSPTSSIPEPRK
jgi:hypothetical protein